MLDSFLPIGQIADDEYPKLYARACKLDMTFPELLRQIGIVHKMEVYTGTSGMQEQTEQREIIDAVLQDCPDLVKEYLVLRQALDKGLLELLFPKDWDNDPSQLIFLGRLFLDYPERLEENQRFWTVFLNGAPRSESAAWVYGIFLFAITGQFSGIKRQVLGRLEKLYGRFHTSRKIAVIYANLRFLMENWIN